MSLRFCGVGKLRNMDLRLVMVVGALCYVSTYVFGLLWTVLFCVCVCVYVCMVEFLRTMYDFELGV